jgi:hypothetical protein
VEEVVIPMSARATTTAPPRRSSGSSPSPDSTRVKADGMNEAGRLEMPGGVLHQGGGLGGKLLDANQAHAAVAAA